MSYIDKKPKRFELHLYVSNQRFNNETWKKDVGEELSILGKQLIDGMDVIPSRILDHGGDVGEIIIDYDDDEDETPQGIMGKPHKADISICLDNAAFDFDWKIGLAETLILIASNIKATHEVEELIRDYNGNTIGSVKITP